MKLLAKLYADFKAVREERRIAPRPHDDPLRLEPRRRQRPSCLNMPILLAGGGFKHGQHLAFATDRNYPLPNLFVSMLQRMGIEEDRSPPPPARCAGWRSRRSERE